MPAPIFRIDCFAVPEPARAKLLSVIRETHALLRRLPGCRRDMIVEQVEGPGKYTFVTLVEWDSQDAIEGAIKAVRALHKDLGFDPPAFLKANGIDADLAFYRPLAA